MDFTRVSENLKARGYAVSCFATSQEAADYLDGAIDGRTVGFGGSATLTAMGLYERLGTHNRVLWHWHAGDAKEQVMRKCLHADVYLASVNGMSEDGTLVNIDRFGNRLAATLYGPGKVYFVVGRNKLCPTYEAALERARNVADAITARAPSASAGD